jgi:hypothetical protein
LSGADVGQEETLGSIEEEFCSIGSEVVSIDGGRVVEEREIGDDGSVSGVVDGSSCERGMVVGESGRGESIETLGTALDRDGSSLNALAMRESGMRD